MKGKCKKILSLVLIFAMLVQMVVGLGNVAQASSATSVTVNSINYRSRYENGLYQLYLDTNTTGVTATWSGWDNTATVKINGTTDVVANACWATDGLLYLQPSLPTDVTLESVTISKGTQFTINGTVYEISADYTLYYYDGGYHDVPKVQGTPTTIKRMRKGEHATRIENGQYMLFLQTSLTDSGDVTWGTWDNIAQVYINGTTACRARAVWSSTEGELYMQPDIPASITTVESILIKAGTQFTLDGGVYEITEDYTVYHYDGGLYDTPKNTFMLEDFEDYTDFELLNPQDTGYADPAFQITKTGVDEGDALQINWASTDTLKSGVHKLLPNDVWAHQNFGENAEDYTYFRLWINNPTFITMELTVRLYSDSTKVYMNADSAILSRKDGTVMSHVIGNASGAGENSSMEIPSGFSGWVAYPLRLDALTGARGRDNITDFSEVNSIEIDVRRPETSDKDSYYVLDNICLSNDSVGKIQNSEDGDYGAAEGLPFETEIKNVIVLVGDGMGQTILQATRDYKGEALHMDSMEYKSTTISSNNIYDELTDSSAGGTALSCGVRTVNGHVALDSDGNSVENMVEFFTRAGKKTGLVTTSYLLDATPTTYGSRGLRGSYSVLGQGLFENNISVLLGGGTDYFNSPITHEDQTYTLLEYAQKVYGYTYVNHASELRSFDGDKVLGVFGAGYMDYEMDRDNSQLSIAEMTEKAISLLEDEEGFFLMVEGGNIDHAAHANDLNRTITDTLAFDDAVKVALEYMKNNPDTLVVVCADHSTGGLTESNGTYRFTTNNHDMSLTACYASGLGSEYFTGLNENADIARAIRKAAWEAKPESEDIEMPGNGSPETETPGTDLSEGKTLESDSVKTESPITGDVSDMAKMLMVALFSVVGICCVVSDRRKYSDQG